MNTEKISARRLTAEEVAELDTDATIFVGADMSGFPRFECYASAHLTKPGSEFEGGFYEVETAFGEVFVTGLGAEEYGIYVEDKGGEEIEVLQSAGVFLHLALFVPGADKDVQEAIYGVLRDKFGAGVVELWHETVALVPDAKVDVHEVPGGRGRKPADGPKKRLIVDDVYVPYTRFAEPQSGWKKEIELHTENAKKIPTI